MPNRRKAYHDECVALAKEAAKTGPRRCSRCKKIKGADDFSNDRNRVNGKFPWCMRCQADHSFETKFQLRDGPLNGHVCPVDDTPVRGHPNRRYCSHHCKERARRWAHQYGLTVEQYRHLLEKTGDLCPICLEIPERWCIDHDHNTKRVTGLVCFYCNIGPLMSSRHDRDRVARLLEYLDNPPAERAGLFIAAPGKRNPSNLHRVWNK